MAGRVGRSKRTHVNVGVAAAGSSQTDAAQVFEGYTAVSGANGTKGVVLSGVHPGAHFYIKGTTSGVLKVYPPAGGVINALSANAAMSLASGVIPAHFFAESATQIYSFPLVPS